MYNYEKADTVALEKFSTSFAELTESSKEVNAHTVSFYKVNTELKSKQLEREQLAVQSDKFDMLDKLYERKNNMANNGAPDAVLSAIQAKIDILLTELL